MGVLLNFIDTGFIIILAILLIISGGIVFYCYRRLNLLEDSIINQGRILQNLIVNLQNNNINHDNINDGNINNELIDAKNKKTNLINNDYTNSKNKIDVSDEEDSNISDTDNCEISDNDSDINDNESDINDNESDINNNNSIDINNDNLDIEKIIDDDSKKVLELSEDILEDITDKQFMTNINNYDPSKIDDKKSDNKIKGLSKMKIDELKQLIIDKNITPDDDINSMKKVELIKILTN